MRIKVITPHGTFLSKDAGDVSKDEFIDMLKQVVAGEVSHIHFELDDASSVFFGIELLKMSVILLIPDD